MTSILNDGVDDTLCGLLTVISSLLFFVLYVLILAILRFRQDRFNAPVYLQMFHMGIADNIQLFIQLIGGVCTLAQFELPTKMNNILGAIINSAWWSWIVFVFSIAMNQFVTFYYQKFYNVIYTKRILRVRVIAFMICDSCVTNLQILICWAVMILSMTFFLSPFCSLRYYRLFFAWRYDETSPLGSTTEYIEFVYVAVGLAVSAIFYGCIFIKVYSMGKQNLSRIAGGMRHETRVLIQASLVCGYTVWTQIHWQFYYLYMPDSRYTDFSCNFVWILNSGMSPIMYLALNKSVRKAFVDLMKFQKPQKSIAAMTVIQSTFDFRRK